MASPDARLDLDVYEYEGQKIYLRQLNETVAELRQHMDTVARCASSLCNALRDAHRSFDRLAAIGPQHPTLAQLSAEFGGVCERLMEPEGTHDTVRRASLPTFMRLLDSECLEVLRSLQSDVSGLEKQKARRRVAVESYRGLRSDLDAKVADYAKKNKSLTESKNYESLRGSVEQARSQYDREVADFTRNANALMARKDAALGHVMQCFFEHTAGFTGVLHTAMSRLFDRTNLRRSK